jgi:predicted PurR-regulated permease PerM
MPRSGSDRFSQLLFYGVVLLVAYLAFTIIQPFLAPLAWAGIFALTFSPVCRWLVPRLGQTRAALATTLIAAFVIVGPVATLLSMLANEIPPAVAFLQTLPQKASPELVREVWDMLRQRVPFPLPEDPTMLITDAGRAVAGFLAPRLGGIAANLLATIGSLFVMLFGLFFFLRDADGMGDLIRRVLPFPEEERERLIVETRDMVVASVGAGLMVAAIQGFLGGVALWLLGMASPVLWGSAMAVCSLIPVVGASLVWAPIAIWWLLTGEVVRGLVLAGLGAGVIGMADNVLRPLLLSGRTTASGLVIFIGLLGGVGAFGFVGLVLGPIVLVTAGTLLDALTRRRSPPRPAAPE